MIVVGLSLAVIAAWAATSSSEEATMTFEQWAANRKISTTVSSRVVGTRPDVPTPPPTPTVVVRPPASKPAPPPPPQVTEAQFMQAETAKCVRCHRQQCSSVDALKNAKWLVPGKPESSKTYTITSDGKKFHTVSDGEKQIIHDFIAQMKP